MTSPSSIIYESPLGALTLVGDERGLREIAFEARSRAAGSDLAVPESLRRAASQLDRYFAGELRRFELSLQFSGTPFQRRVWLELQRIPYGATTTYKALARSLGEELERAPFSPRGVGAAVARTPIPIVIPCHRVIGSDGSLTGYGGGLDRKLALLELEGSAGAVVVPGRTLGHHYSQQQLV